jgi:hypothetical protein
VIDNVILKLTWSYIHVSLQPLIGSLITMSQDNLQQTPAKHSLPYRILYYAMYLLIYASMSKYPSIHALNHAFTCSIHLLIRLSIYTSIQLPISSQAFWVVTPCSVVEGAPCCLHLRGKDGGSMELRNAGILPHHYTVSQPRKPRLESSPV